MRKAYLGIKYKLYSTKRRYEISIRSQLTISYFENFSDSEIVHRLVLGSLANRERNRSASRNRRSYSAQTRPIAPASHSRDIEARYSDSWKAPRFVNYTDTGKTDENNKESEITTRSLSQRPRTLQIVEVGSVPYKYSVVRHVEEPQSDTVREGTLRDHPN